MIYFSSPVHLWHLQSGSRSGPMRGWCSAPACWSPPESCWSASGRSETTEETKLSDTCVHPQHTQRTSSNIEFVGTAYTFWSYFFWCVDIFVESFEGINVELHELSQQIKVALQDVSRRTAAVYDAKQDVLSRDGNAEWAVVHSKGQKQRQSVSSWDVVIVLPLVDLSSGGTFGLHRRWLLWENFPLPLPARICTHNRKLQQNKKALEKHVEKYS